MNELKNRLLCSDLDYDTLSLEDARKIYEMKEKEQIIGKYTFPQKPSKDGYYRIYVKDSTKKSGRKQIFARSLLELQDKVYEYEKGISGNARKTFRDVFEIVQSEKLKYVKDAEKILSVKNTICRNRSEYNRFFKGTDFEKMFVDEIAKIDIENVVLMNMRRYDIRIKALSSLKSILSSVFTLAFEEYWISDNVFQRINFKKFGNLLVDSIPVENRVHTDEELHRMLDFIHEYQRIKPSYVPSYALEMQILMGLRRGEVPPLELADIHEDYIMISKEQLTVRKSKDNPKEYFAVVHHTKNYKNRRFPRTKEIDLFLERIMSMHQMFYPESKYLFPAKNENGIITNNIVYKFYRRMCDKLGIEKRTDVITGPHSFRRNGITDVVNATNGNIIIASQLFGNTPEVAKQNYFVGTDLELVREVLDTRKLS